MRQFVGALALLALCACAGTSTSLPAAGTDSAMVNTECPIMGKPASVAWVETWKDQSIGFCCKGCRDGFRAGTDAEKDDALKTALGN